MLATSKEIISDAVGHFPIRTLEIVININDQTRNTDQLEANISVLEPLTISEDVVVSQNVGKEIHHRRELELHGVISISDPTRADHMDNAVVVFWTGLYRVIEADGGS